MQYSYDQSEPFRLAPFYIDRVLKGTKPADLPLRLSTRLGGYHSLTHCATYFIITFWPLPEMCCIATSRPVFEVLRTRFAQFEPFSK